MTITLPLPAKALSPNARSHWSKRHRATKAHRNRAKLITLEALGGATDRTFTRYTLAFYFPVCRGRDDDNAAASCKAYRDGIADALQIDDSTLQAAGVTLLLDPSNPRLEITLLP